MKGPLSVLGLLLLATSVAFGLPEDLDDVALLLTVQSGSGEFANSGRYLFVTTDHPTGFYSIFQAREGAWVPEFSGAYAYSPSSGQLSLTKEAEPGRILTASFDFDSRNRGSYHLASELGEQVGTIRMILGYVGDYWFDSRFGQGEWFYGGGDRETRVFHHAAHGWIQTDWASRWGYFQNTGWGYFAEYPYLYFIERKQWYYFQGGDYLTGRWFYNLQTGVSEQF